MVYTTLLNDKKHNGEMTRLEPNKFGFDYNKKPAINSWFHLLDGWGSNPRPTGYSFLFLSKKTGLFHHPCINLIWSRAFRVRSASNPFYESYSHKGIVS